MEYRIAAHKTKYSGIEFRSRLEARWACFFDIVKWNWLYEPIELYGWIPDFRVEFPCGHSECPSSHSLLVEVKPFFSIADFYGHPCMDYPYGCRYLNNEIEEKIPAHASAAFGANPSITYWEMSHGAGGGVESIDRWVYQDIDAAWNLAGNVTQYRKK